MSTERPNPAELPPEDGRFTLNSIRTRADDLYVARPELIEPGHTNEWQQLLLPSPIDDEQVVQTYRLLPTVAAELLDDYRFLGMIKVLDVRTGEISAFYQVGFWEETERVELLKLKAVTSARKLQAFTPALADYSQMVRANSLLGTLIETS
ncbi:hypothetical protein EXS54_01220 [Patescibacteria group bacterium]|nr:hypothetical protein [Patescibacteria group bacterium]